MFHPLKCSSGGLLIKKAFSRAQSIVVSLTLNCPLWVAGWAHWALQLFPTSRGVKTLCLPPIHMHSHMHKHSLQSLVLESRWEPIASGRAQRPDLSQAAGGLKLGGRWKVGAWSTPLVSPRLVVAVDTDLDYSDIEWFDLETNRDHSVIFEIASKYCI